MLSSVNVWIVDGDLNGSLALKVVEVLQYGGQRGHFPHSPFFPPGMQRSEWRGLSKQLVSSRIVFAR
jgi:hypothetical protein